MTGTGGLLRLEDARDRVLSAIGMPVPSEDLPVTRALGRVLAIAAHSRTALPPWDNSAMDGYAIRSVDVRAATDAQPAPLRVVGEIAAGAVAELALGPGEAMRIATGAPIPPGADAVVPVELTTAADAEGRPTGERGREASGPLPAACLVHATVEPGGSIRARGSDLEPGIELVVAGTALGAAEISLLAGAGVVDVAVYRRPRLAVLATGDEIRAPGEPLGPAGIPDANGPGLAALAERAGADVRVLGVAPDRLEAVEGRIRSALDWADAIVVSGGVSVGPYDVVRAAFGSIGEVDLWRVAIQPGKPFAFGLARETGEPRRTLLFGLPGNPVSSFVTFELFVRPALRKLAGRRPDDLLRPVDSAVLEDPVSKSPGRRAFLRVTAARAEDGSGRICRDGAGRVRVRLAGGQGGQGSHVLSALAAADALAVVPEESDTLPAGAAVDLWWLDRP